MSLFSATQFWRQKVLEVAKDHRDVTFAIANEQNFPEELKALALDDSGEEINVGCFDESEKRYRMDPEEEFSEDSLREFVENFKEGTNIQTLLSTNKYLLQTEFKVRTVKLRTEQREKTRIHNFTVRTENTRLLLVRCLCYLCGNRPRGKGN